MDLRQLEYFSAIVKEGGFNKAGAKLFISQSAISRKIRLLEQELGEPVFLRSGKRIILTPTGEALLRHSRVIFHHLKALKLEMLEEAGLQRGELSIGATLTTCVTCCRRFSRSSVESSQISSCGSASAWRRRSSLR